MAENESSVRHLRHRLGGYREYAATQPLAKFSEAIWIYRTPRSTSPFDVTFHRVLPDPALSLAFCCFREAGGPPVEPRLVIVGPKSKPSLCAFRRGYEMAAIRLKLEWVDPLLGLVPGEHDGAVTDLSLMLPHFAEPLFERLLGTRTQEEAMSMLVTTLVERSRRGPASHSRASAHALDVMRRTAGRPPLGMLARHMAVSTRHLRRIVRREAGISLKTYARTLRFLRAMMFADLASRPEWARIAAESGFCDQSHLVRECRALCALSPRQVYRERRVEAEMSNPC